jgi:hypothetical protein
MFIEEVERKMGIKIWSRGYADDLVFSVSG